jgi:hypothetical protein
VDIYYKVKVKGLFFKKVDDFTVDINFDDGKADMENDPYETTNLVDEYPEIVEKLKSMAENHKQQWWE